MTCSDNDVHVAGRYVERAARGGRKEEEKKIE